MKLKYDLEVSNYTIDKKLSTLINQIYKLLPIREEGSDWVKPLETIIEELIGIDRLFIEEEYKFFTLICKLEGLFFLENEEDFQLYRRIIFECLSLVGDIQNAIA